MSPILALLCPDPAASETIRRRLGLAWELPVASDLDDLVRLLEGGAKSEPSVEGGGEGRGFDEGPRWVLVASEVSAQERSRLLDEAGRRVGRWRILDLFEGRNGLSGRPISVGYEEPARTFLDRLPDGEEPSDLLELHTMLEVISRARHDLNNPLTAAMAELQLTLMDVEEPSELRSSLVVVQDQLERIRDLVSDLRRLRPPRDDG